MSQVSSAWKRAIAPLLLGTTLCGGEIRPQLSRLELEEMFGMEQFQTAYNLPEPAVTARRETPLPAARSVAGYLLPAESPANRLVRAGNPSADLVRYVERRGVPPATPARKPIPDLERELMVSIAALLFFVSFSLTWLCRNRTPYSEADEKLLKGESPHVPGLVFSTHAGYQSISYVAGSGDRRGGPPRRGPALAATEFRGRAAAVGGR